MYAKRAQLICRRKITLANSASSGQVDTPAFLKKIVALLKETMVAEACVSDALAIEDRDATAYDGISALIGAAKRLLSTATTVYWEALLVGL